MQVPPWLLEGSNGALAITFLCLIAFQAAYLVWAWVKIRDGAATPWVGSAYRQTKPVVALTMLFFGVMLRAGSLWIDRAAENRGLEVATAAEVSIALHVLGTAAMIIGALCWLRVTMPRLCGWRTWAIVIGLAVAAWLSPLVY